MMDLTQIIWKKLTRTELCALYRNEMTRDFPKDELRELPNLLQLYDSGRYLPYGVFDAGHLAPTQAPEYGKNTLCGYLNVVHPHDMPRPIAFLDYFATAPALRGNGLGEKLLAQLCEQEAKNGTLALIWEAETPAFAPDAAMATRRMGFYTRAGGKPTGLRNRVYGVWFDILYRPCAGELTTDTAEEALLHTYHQLMTPERFAAEYLLEKMA